MIDRRRVLIGIGGVAGVAVAYAVLGDHFRSGYGLLTEVAAAKTIGAEHIRENGAPESIDAISNLLIGTDEEIARAVRNAIRADFEAGRVVSVAHWQLAQTEADLCAFVALGH